MYNAGLDNGLWEDGIDRFGKALETVDNRNQAFR